MMHLHRAFLCIVVHPKRFTIIMGGKKFNSSNNKIQRRTSGGGDVLCCILLLLELNFFIVNVKCARCFYKLFKQRKVWERRKTKNY